MSTEFDALMSGMGVKRMDKKSGTPRRSATKSGVKPKPVVRRAPKPPASKRQAGTEAADSDRIAALERGLKLVKDEREKAEAKVSTLRSKVKRLRAQLKDLEAAAEAVPPSIAETLAGWGYESAEDRQTVMLADGWMERILGEPVLSDAEELRGELAAQFVRVCERCSVPDGRSALLGPPAHCELCGGYDTEREARRFLDAALINGRLRIVVVGRETAHHRMIRERVGDKRLVLTQIPGTTVREVSQAQVDVDHADAVIVWDPGSVSDELLEVYRQAPRMGEVPAGPVGAFLSDAAAIVARD